MNLLHKKNRSIPDNPRAYRGIIARGVGVNALGIVGKALTPLSFIFLTRLYGAVSMGFFYLAYVIIEIALTLTISGFADAMVMFGSRSLATEDDNTFYRVLLTSLTITMAISIGLYFLFLLGAPSLSMLYYSQPGLSPVLKTMALAIPLATLTTIVINSTKSLLIMKWEALLLGFFQPLLLLLCGIGFYYTQPTAEGLASAYACTHGIVALLSLFVFGHCFSFRSFYRSFKQCRLLKAVVFFAVPQNLNMTFTRLVVNMDILMLGYFGFSPENLAFYGMGAQVVRNIRQIKHAFAGIYGPIISRLHTQQNLDGMNSTFAMVINWTSAVALPVIICVAILRKELLLLFSPQFTGETGYMLLLLLPVLLSCSIGMAGNVIVMTGHSLWNLFNSIIAILSNIVLNLLLIPTLGLFGAATATAISATVISILQLLEASRLVSVKVNFKVLGRNYSLCMVAYVAAWIVASVLPVSMLAARLSNVFFACGFYIWLQYWWHNMVLAKKNGCDIPC